MQISQIVDRTLLVVRWGTTTSGVARHALRQLLDVGAEVSVILSMVDLKLAASYGDPVAGAYKQFANYYGRSPGA